MRAQAEWMVKFGTSRQSWLNLICLPFAGGGSAIFRSWPEGLASDVAVWAARLPGRENRLLEQPYTDAHELVAALLPAIRPLTDRPYAVFGHSMGALLAYEVARELVALGARQPVCLIVAGNNAAHTLADPPGLHRLPDKHLIDALRDYGATPELVLTQPALLDLFLPMIRADFSVAETYRHRPGLTLDCPIVVCRGSEDQDCSAEGALAWSELTTGPCLQFTFPGGHFFIDSERDSLLDMLNDLLTTTAAAPY